METKFCDVTSVVTRVAIPRVSWYVAVRTIAKKEIPACDWSAVEALALAVPAVRSLHQRRGSPAHLSPPGYRGGGNRRKVETVQRSPGENMFV